MGSTKIWVLSNAGPNAFWLCEPRSSHLILRMPKQLCKARYHIIAVDLNLVQGFSSLGTLDCNDIIGPDSLLHPLLR